MVLMRSIYGKSIRLSYTETLIQHDSIMLITFLPIGVIPGFLYHLLSFKTQLFIIQAEF